MISVPVSSVGGIPSDAVTPRSITDLTLSFTAESRDIGAATNQAKEMLDALHIKTTSFNIELVVASSGPYEEHT